jgi:hypothetical protein
MSATRDVEKSISTRATFPSSLLNIFANGSVWYMRKPRDVPRDLIVSKRRIGRHDKLTNSKTAVVLVKSDEIHSHRNVWAAKVQLEALRW